MADVLNNPLENVYRVESPSKVLISLAQHKTWFTTDTYMRIYERNKLKPILFVADGDNTTLLSSNILIKPVKCSKIHIRYNEEKFINAQVKEAEVVANNINSRTVHYIMKAFPSGWRPFECPTTKTSVPETTLCSSGVKSWRSTRRAIACNSCRFC